MNVPILSLRECRGLAIAAVGLLLVGLSIATSRADILYVVNIDTATIVKFTSGGVDSVFASSGLNGPHGLAFDSAGNLYAANINNDTIEKITPDGVGSVFASSGLNRPTGLAFDNAGNLYAANHDNNTIVKFTSDGVGSVFCQQRIGPTTRPCL